MEIFRMIPLALALTAANALQASCPDLSGDYACPDGAARDRHVSFSQTKTDGVTTYFMNIDGIPWRLVADGADRTIGAQTINASCGSGMLEIRVVKENRVIYNFYRVNYKSQLSVTKKYAEVPSGAIREVRHSTCNVQ